MSSNVGRDSYTLRDQEGKNEYIKIHMWLCRQEIHKQCKKCGVGREKSQIEWALIHGFKHAKDVRHYIPLCLSCHRRYDFSDEVRAKMSAARKGISRPCNWRSIKQISKSGELIATYKSVTEAMNATSVSITAISNVLRGTHKTSGGFIWEYNKN